MGNKLVPLQRKYQKKIMYFLDLIFSHYMSKCAVIIVFFSVWLF